MTGSVDQKVRISVGFTPKTETALAAEARRLGISFGDMVRRITDIWADDWRRRNDKAPERVNLYDHPSSHPPLRTAR